MARSACTPTAIATGRDATWLLQGLWAPASHTPRAAQSQLTVNRVAFIISSCRAVGQVFAYHLAQGGAAVTIFVKKSYAPFLSGYQLALYQFAGRKSSWKVLNDYNVVSDVNDLGRYTFDYIICTVNAADLHRSAVGAADSHAGWLQRFVSKLPRASAFVMVTDGLEDKDALLKSTELKEEQLVECGITFIAWQAPLPGERWNPLAGPRPDSADVVQRRDHQHVAYPRTDSSDREIERPSDRHCAPVAYSLESSMLFSGHDADGGRVRSLVRLCNAGGMPAHVVSPSVGYHMNGLTAVFMCLLVALESFNWSLSTMRKSGNLSAVCAAGRQALSVAAMKMERPGVNWFQYLLVAPVLWTLLAVVQSGIVFAWDIEAYLKYHFTKVGEQTKVSVCWCLRGSPIALTKYEVGMAAATTEAAVVCEATVTAIPNSSTHKPLAPHLQLFVDDYQRLGRQYNLPTDAITNITSWNQRWSSTSGR